MTIAELNQAMAARKCSMAFHTRNRIKSINDVVPHSMSWGDLNALEKDVAKEARALLDRVEAKVATADAEGAQSLETAHDGFMLLYDALSEEKDARSFIGSKEPRSEKYHPKILAQRPGHDAAEARTDGMDAEAAETVYALQPEERFTSWARAKSNGAEEYRGLSLGNYLRSMVLGGKTDLERRALSEGSDSAGGYTTPTPLSAELIDLLRAASVVTQAGARTVPLTSDNNNIAKLLTDPVPAWRLEAGAVAESDPTFGLINLVPRSLAVQVKLSSELLEDSLNLSTELPRIVAAAMAVELDRAALLGSGTAPQPRGVANVSGIGTFAQDGVIAGYGNLSKARTGILTANAGPVSAFIMHPRDEGAFTDLADTTGQPLMAPRGVADIPMLTTTSIPVDGGSGSDESIIFAGNFANLLVGIRSDIRVEVIKTSAYASNLQYTLVAHMRADVAVTHAGAFYTLTGVGQGG